MVRVSSYHLLAFALGVVYVAPSVDTSSFSALLSPWSMQETSSCLLRLAEASALRTFQGKKVAEDEKKEVVGANQGYDDEDDEDDDVVPLKPKGPTIRSISSTGHRRKKKMKQWLIWTSLGLSVAAVVGALAFAFRPGQEREHLEIASALNSLFEDKAPTPEKDRILLLRCAALFASLMAFPVKQARYKLQKLFFHLRRIARNVRLDPKMEALKLLHYLGAGLSRYGRIGMATLGFAAIAYRAYNTGATYRLPSWEEFITSYNRVRSGNSYGYRFR